MYPLRHISHVTRSSGSTTRRGRTPRHSGSTGLSGLIPGLAPDGRWYPSIRQRPSAEAETAPSSSGLTEGPVRPAVPTGDAPHGAPIRSRRRRAGQGRSPGGRDGAAGAKVLGQMGLGDAVMREQVLTVPPHLDLASYDPQLSCGAHVSSPFPPMLSLPPHSPAGSRERSADLSPTHAGPWQLRQAPSHPASRQEP